MTSVTRTANRSMVNSSSAALIAGCAFVALAPAVRAQAVPGPTPAAAGGAQTASGGAMSRSPNVPDPPSSSATAASGGSASLGEVLVTATKTGELSVQRVPFSVQALTGAQLSDTGAIDFSDFYHSIPGLTISDDGPGDKRYIIRGISNAAGAGTVGVYLDDVVITGENSQTGGGQQTDVQLFDIQRVEVLKGPQGTTFGSDSMAGTIRYITNQPNLTQFGGNVRVEGRDTDGSSAPGPELDGAINLPVVPGRVAVRLAAFYNDLPGWIDNRFESDANTEKTSAERAEATFAASKNLTFTGMYMQQTTHQDARSYYSTTDYLGNPIEQKFYQPDLSRTPHDEQSDIYNATMQYSRPFGTFFVTASDFIRQITFAEDASLVASAYLGLPLTGSAESVLAQPKHRKLADYEARFTSSWGGPIQLLAGLYYQDEQRNFRSYWNTLDAEGYINNIDGTTYLNRTVYDSIEEKAVYAQLTYQATEKLRLIAGGRYFDIATSENSDAITAFGGGPGSGPGPELRFPSSAPIGRFNVSYDFTQDWMAYAQVAQGYRSGGPNDTTAAEIAHVSIPDGYNSDSLVNYEIGEKTGFLDRRLFVDSALYHIVWNNIQLQDQATNGQASFPYTGNGGQAKIDGAEMSIDARPVAGLTLGAAVNYNYARLTQNEPAPSIGVAGNLLPYVPRMTASVSGEYNTLLGDNDLIGDFGGDVSYTSSSATDLNASGGSSSDYRVLHSYGLVNVHAGLSRGPYKLSLIVENLLNNTTVINVTSVAFGLYPDQLWTNRPRTVSLALSAEF